MTLFRKISHETQAENLNLFFVAMNFSLHELLRMPTKHQAVFANFTVYFLFSTMYADLVPNY